ncbi:hypothetical protein N9K16_02750 [Alphaproteobacteria bacterium]|nr:hypothetical protein [Alphaproteobacteria bacterium]
MSDQNQGRMKIIYHEAMTAYCPPPGMFDAEPSDLLDIQMTQPESHEKLANTASVLKRGPVGMHLDWETARSANDAEILTFHTQAYLDQLKEASKTGVYMSASTYIYPDSMKAVLLAAGAAVDAAKAVVSGEYKMAYALVRPPAHHAQPEQADGYCFVNNVGLAVHEALKSGLKRVAVVDWDVHHGNGTQQGFYDRDDVLTISMHMNHGAWGPTHLQTGDVDETGNGTGEGYNLNLPLPMGTGNHGYLTAFDRCVVPALRKFKPDLIVSANGQDANAFDPNGRQCVSMAGFYQLGRRLHSLAEELCDGKIVITQEGGYNPTYAPYCAHAVVEGLLGQKQQLEDPIAFYPDDVDGGEAAVEALVKRHPLL